MHSSSTNCIVRNLHTSGNDADHVQYKNVAQAAARRPAPLVLCREWQHKPLQRRPYRGQFL